VDITSEAGLAATRSGPVERRKVGVLGLGYVGLPLALAAAEAGHHVVGYDTSAVKVAEVQAGRTDLVDLDHDRLAAQLAHGALSVTTEAKDLGACQVYVICVPTPLRDGSPDLSMVLAAVDAVAAVLDPEDLVVLESTTWPGTTTGVIAPRLAERSGLVPGVDMHLVFSPERIDPGNRQFPLAAIPKLVGGVTRQDGELAAAFYGTFLDTVHIVSGPTEAELAKIVENTYRHVNMALVNELAMLYSDTDVDLREAIEAAATKPFGFMPFYPGPGVGGHCIPVDPMYLIWHARRTGRTLQVVETAEQVNRSMPGHVVSRVAALLNGRDRSLRGSRVLLLGISYKPGVADLRESSAYAVARQLRGHGALVTWHDPLVRAEQDFLGLPRLGVLDEQALRDSDLVVLHTPHVQYHETEVWQAPVVLDPHGALHGVGLTNVFDL
jgi:nucleotide sugar dehydrogenase